MDPKIVAWVGLGSGAGGIARHLLSVALTRGHFPLGTLTVNVLGSFLLAFLLFSHAVTGWADRGMLAALGTGVMGGFTTMSAFSQETVSLAGQGEGTLALVYVGATLALCLLAAYLGRLVALALFPHAA